MRLAAAAFAMAMAGCATAAEEVPVRGGGACDSTKAQKLVGRARSARLGEEALRLSGATTLRWIPPGGMVTMDYREDRLNLRLDSKNKVVKIGCG